MKTMFLGMDHVIEIHRDQILRHGGILGIKDMRLLQWALVVPSAVIAGRSIHADPFEIAGAYLFHIVQNHPFLEGNRRTGSVTALVFLFLNGIDIDVDGRVLEVLVRSVAQGEVPKIAIADFFRRHAK